MSALTGYTLPLSTLLTVQEADKLSHRRMGILFEAQSVETPHGVLMLFKHEAVRAWGEREILDVRRHFASVALGRVRGCCDGCGKRGVKLDRSLYGDPYCVECHEMYSRREDALCDLEDSFKAMLDAYCDRWADKDDLFALLGSDGGIAKTAFHDLLLKRLHRHLYGNEEG